MIMYEEIMMPRYGALIILFLGNEDGHEVINVNDRFIGINQI